MGGPGGGGWTGAPQSPPPQPPPPLSQHPASVPPTSPRAAVFSPRRSEEKSEQVEGGAGVGVSVCYSACWWDWGVGGWGYRVVLFPTALILFSPAEGREGGPRVNNVGFFKLFLSHTPLTKKYCI